MPEPALSRKGFGMKVARSPCLRATPWMRRRSSTASSAAASASARWWRLISNWPGAASEMIAVGRQALDARPPRASPAGRARTRRGRRSHTCSGAPVRRARREHGHAARRPGRARGFRQVEFELEGDDGTEALRGEPVDHRRQGMARVELPGPAVGQMHGESVCMRRAGGPWHGLERARHGSAKPSRSPVSIWMPVSSTSRPQTSRPNIDSGMATPSSITLSSEEPGSHLPRRMPLVSGSRTSTTSTASGSARARRTARDIAGGRGRAGRLDNP